MKNKLIMIVLAAFLLPTTSCDNEALLDLNNNPNASTELDFDFILSHVQGFMTNNGHIQSRGNIIYSSTMIQQFASTAGFVSGDKYSWSDSYSGAVFEGYYPDLLKNATHVVDNTKDTEEVNTYAMALVVRTYALHRITDLYGDVPYSEAGRGLEGQEYWFPKYDAQEDIYGMIVSDLREARDILSASAPNPGTQDIYYHGDIDQWKRFINSLLVRVGMRMSKVDATLAKSVVEEAANHASGTFQSNDDNTVVFHNNAARNGNSEVIISDNYKAGNARLSKTFIDWMKDSSDPRLMIISGGVGNPDGDPTEWNTDPSAQAGMPNGYDSETIKQAAVDEGLIATPDDYVDNNIFSFINPMLYDYADPMFLHTYAEVELLLAEALLKGWNVPGTPEEHFDNAVAAAINKWTAYDESFAVDAGTISDYIDGLGFDAASAADKERMIGEQYWAATFLDNCYEGYANWRRTGYPVLTPVDYPGNETGGTIPRRLRYPTFEERENPDNYQAAVAAQGPDQFTTRVWWDKTN
jgi:hypothetical protein